MPKKIVLIVVGCLLGLTGLFATLTGAAALIVLGPHSSIRSASHSISSPANALLSPPAPVRNEATLAAALGTPTIHVHVTTATPGGVFIGIAPAGQVDRYLAGASVAVVNDLTTGPHRLNPPGHIGSALPVPPADQTFWVARAAGSSQADLAWTPRDGTYRIVLMRADAHPGIDVQARVGLTIPSLTGIATGLAVGGSIMLVLAALALLFGLLGAKTSVKHDRNPAPRPVGTSPFAESPLV